MWKAMTFEVLSSELLKAVEAETLMINWERARPIINLGSFKFYEIAQNYGTAKTLQISLSPSNSCAKTSLP